MESRTKLKLSESQVRLAEALAATERLAAAEAEAQRQRAAVEEAAGRSGISQRLGFIIRLAGPVDMAQWSGHAGEKQWYFHMPVV